MEVLTKDGLSFLARWGHFLAGITWIGLLYYFNLVQVPAFAQMDASARTDAIRRVVPRALWWFRWAALFTFIFGVAILIIDWDEYDNTLPGVAILSGAFLGTIMLVNVWGVIWPNQKIVIANAEATATGGQALPNAAAAGRKAFVASRTNVLLSATMLFFMGAAHHFAPMAGDHFVASGSSSQVGVYWGFLVVVAALIEANALGLLGGMAAGSMLRKPLETVQSVVISAFVLALFIYVVGWEVLLRTM